MKQTLLVGMMAITMLPVYAGFTEEPPQDKTRSKRGWLGVSIQDVSKSLAEEYDLKTEDGAYISDVQDESPADSVGLKKGDVIIEFGGRKIYDADDLAKSVGRTEPGTRSTVVILRNGERKTFTLAVGKLPRRSSFAWSMGDGKRFRMFHGGTGMLGMGTISLSEQLAKYFGAPNDEGVLVEMVKKGSPAEKAGIMAGDVILKIGTRTIEDMGDMWKALEKYDEGDKVDVEILRKGAKKTVKVEVEEMEDGPWGAIPMVPPVPNIHVFPRHPSTDFEFDFDTEVAPQLKSLERKIRNLHPKLEERIERKIRTALRITTV
ncbi:MAG: PDZ domain-containing protein [Bacteroidota bacterium]